MSEIRKWLVGIGLDQYADAFQANDDLVLKAAVAAAAFGLDGRLAIAAPARGQRTPDPTRGFFRYKVGLEPLNALLYMMAFGRRPMIQLISATRQLAKRNAPWRPPALRPPS